MIAFHGDPKIKAKYLKRVRAHAEADELVKGVYYEKDANGKVRACGVGCTVHSSSHAAYEKELGIPQLLARLEDQIFECLPNDLAMTWPDRFLSAIKLGADLSKVWPRFAIWLLGDPKHGVIRHCWLDGDKAVKDVMTLFERQLGGDTPTTNEWLDARERCWEARRDAADAAAAAAAAADAATAATYAAYAAAAAAAYAAADAAYAADAYAAADAAYAATAAAYAAACSKHYVLMSEKLLELLAEAKPVRMPS